MNSTNRIEKAIELHQKGYNCGQAVFGTFLDMFNIELETALKLAQPLGSGFSGLREICGAVAAMGLVIGVQQGSSDAKDTVTKKQCYAKVKELAKQFELENGSIICKELLGFVAKDGITIKKKPCKEYVRQCAALLVEYFENKT